MANQSIALLAKHYPVDVPGITGAAQQARINDFRLENAPLENEVERMKLGEERGKLSALGDYRTRLGAGDPNAAESLDAFPELATEFDKALGGMTPEERRKAVMRTKAFGAAAQFVMGFPEGSPEQEQAWGTALKSLRKGGFIDDQTYEIALKSGPNRMLLNQAMETTKFVEKYADPKVENDTRYTDARIDDIGTDNERADREADNRMTNRDSRTGALNEQGDARVGIMRDRETNRVKDVKAPKGSGKNPADAAYKRIDKIAEDQGIDYGTPEYDEIKRKVFSEMGISEGAPSASPTIQEGQTATNKETGERLIFKDGKWQPL